MTITNGSQILLSDLNALTNATLALERADNAQLPLLFELSFTFKSMHIGGGSPTPEHAKKAIFTAPRDLWVEALTVAALSTNGTTTVTLAQAIAGDALAFVPLSATFNGAGAGVTINTARFLCDNTRAPAKTASLGQNPCFRAIPKGARMKLSFSTTNTLTSPIMNVVVVCRGGYARP